MTVPRLDEAVSVKGRFARSVRSDKDAGQAEQLDGYLPTARSLEVVRRLTNGMLHDDGTRSFSITGPYGSGKSSLAVFLDALLGGTADNAHKAAVRLLREHDPSTAERLAQARTEMGAGTSGFVRAVITAPQREPITATVLRALQRGAKRARVAKGLRDDLDAALDRAASVRLASPSYQEIRALITRLAERKPVLLVIDEFGKNLEAFASGGSDSDLYLLQELAEWASGDDRLPLVLVTIQHLAFEAYATDTTAAQRREWAKVQGRFEDISYVDSAAATRGLIGAALKHSTARAYVRARDVAATAAAEAADAAGLPGVADADLVAACYPLHPSTLLALPPLCARYGQNERTLFSFLASSEPQSVTSFTRETELGDELPWVRLDRVYDYFVESASTFVGASRDANRWMEVETTIRDTHGLTTAQKRVLKAVGVLNLVAAAGAIRASADLLAFALADGTDGLEEGDAVVTRLTELAGLGLVTYRDFASEYRIWQGSDYDISAALRSARRQVRTESLADVLSETMPLWPVVAARHSTQCNTMRAFARSFVDATTRKVFPPRAGDVRDGTLLYSLSPEPSVDVTDHVTPVVLVTPPIDLLDAVEDATVEVAALRLLLDDPALSESDRAARRELSERLALARQHLERAVDDAFGVGGTWRWLNAPKGRDGELKPLRGTDALSDVLDIVYEHAPEVAYEAINRADLTSQGAKARRILLEAALTPSLAKLERFGLSGDGPEVGIYHAVFAKSGVHVPDEAFSGDHVTDEWRPVWDHLNDSLRSATGDAVTIAHVLDEIMRPPYGLRQGVATVLLTAALIHNASDIAVYEHGTFKPRLDAAMSERMVRNPANFAVKHLAATNSRSKRAKAVKALHLELGDVLGGTSSTTAARDATVLSTVMLLLQPFHTGQATAFTRRTKLFGAAWGDPTVTPERAEQLRKVRDALVLTQEPDVLLFEALPEAVGLGPLPASGKGAESMTTKQIGEFASAVAQAAGEIAGVHGGLCSHILEVIRDATQTKNLKMLAANAETLDGVQVVAANVRTFAGLARMADSVDAASFAQQVATAVTGTPPSEWSDADVPGYVTRVREVASSFRRVTALAHALRTQAEGEAFVAIAIDITSADGRHTPEVVAVRDSDRAALSADVATLVHAAREHVGTDAAAIRTVMALLAEQLLVDSLAAVDADATERGRKHG
jgi:ABC-type molybdenum transport system ATPase subunit/photorepair protein PhrA